MFEPEFSKKFLNSSVVPPAPKLKQKLSENDNNNDDSNSSYNNECNNYYTSKSPPIFDLLVAFVRKKEEAQTHLPVAHEISA